MKAGLAHHGYTGCHSQDYIVVPRWIDLHRQTSHVCYSIRRQGRRKPLIVHYNRFKSHPSCPSSDACGPDSELHVPLPCRPPHLALVAHLSRRLRLQLRLRRTDRYHPPSSPRQSLHPRRPSPFRHRLSLRIMRDGHFVRVYIVQYC